jgi:hypothetical protein
MDGPLTDLRLRDRVAFAPGDIFSELPGGLDAYFLKWIIHDWDDVAASRILRVCREAMRPGARLLLAEMVIEPGHDPNPSNVLDIAMLVLTGGKNGRRMSLPACFGRRDSRSVGSSQRPRPLASWKVVPSEPTRPGATEAGRCYDVYK